MPGADWLAGGIALVVLAGCLPLDREEDLRHEVGRLVFLAQTRDFRSTSTCTAASFEVISDQLRTTGGAYRVSSVRDALPRLQKGEAVAFDIPGASPNAISEQLMSLSLPVGLGLVSAVVGPARGCMSEVFKSDVAAILASPDTTLVYDPGSDAALLLYRPLPVAFFLRGNVQRCQTCQSSEHRRPWPSWLSAATRGGRGPPAGAAVACRSTG